MKKILVTGANGQLGLCLKTRSKEDKTLDFVFLDSKALDITNTDQINDVFINIDFDYCINCAAYTAVDNAEDNEDKAIKVNTLGVKHLAKACKQNNVTLIHVSTDFVFDGLKIKPYKEEDITNPVSVYGKTKRDGELEIISILDNYFIIRTSWVYSEFGSNFVKTMLRLSKDRDALGIVNDQIGSPTNANDLSAAIIEIIKKKNKEYGIYNYSNLGSATWYDFANAIFEYSKIKIETNPVTSDQFITKAKRPKYSLLDKTKISKIFDLKIPNWKDSLENHIKNNLSQGIKQMNNSKLKLAIEASLRAGKVIMEIYDSKIDVEYKDDESPITEADKQANDIINEFLIPTGIPIISEENKQTDYQTRKSWKTCWIVDPVDGTKEFIKRNGEFTVNIALITNGKPELGVVYVPATKTIYAADVNTNEAFKAQLDSHNASIEDVLNSATILQPKASNSNPIQVVGSRSHMSQETLEFVESIKKDGKEVEVVSKGSSLKFCLVAEGNADVYPRFAPTMEWDTAAGQAICNAIGVDVISHETKKQLLYNKENLLNPWFIVSK